MDVFKMFTFWRSFSVTLQVKVRRDRLVGFLVFAIALLLAVVCFSYYCYHICFHVPKHRNEDITAIPEGEQYASLAQKMLEISLIMQDAASEYVSIVAKDGTKLWGKLYAYYPDAPLVIAFHGYRSMAVRDSAGAFALCQKLGFNILAVDQRSHGQSEDNAITFGIRERHDCLDWITYANTRFGNHTPIVLCGISMGAATVLMASELALPGNVLGIMADCPYASPEAIINKVAADWGYPLFLANPVIRLGARLFARLNLRESSALEAVRYASVPILLIHGEDDRFVPCQMSKDIYENCSSPAQLHTFPNAGHGLCYILDPNRYERICVSFLWSLEPLRPWLQKSSYANSILQE